MEFCIILSLHVAFPHCLSVLNLKHFGFLVPNSANHLLCSNIDTYVHIIQVTPHTYYIKASILVD